MIKSPKKVSRAARTRKKQLKYEVFYSRDGFRQKVPRSYCLWKISRGNQTKEISKCRKGRSDVSGDKLEQSRATRNRKGHKSDSNNNKLDIDKQSENQKQEKGSSRRRSTMEKKRRRKRRQLKRKKKKRTEREQV